ILRIRNWAAAASGFPHWNGPSVNPQIMAQARLPAWRRPPAGFVKAGVSGNRRLPGGDVIFESVGILLVNELERKTFFQVSDDTSEYLAERAPGLQRRPFFGRDSSARHRQIDDPACHSGAV